MTNLLGLREIGHHIALVAALSSGLAASLPARGAAGDAAATVTLTVDYGDGALKTVSNIAWAKGETVLDVMKAATTRPHGISFGFTGTGASAVLTKIDDVQNQGGGAGRKNWQYWVNGTYGDRSFATFELQAQDLIVWRFATEQGK